MVINLKSIGKLVGGLMFTDSADIYRFETITDNVGSEKTVIPEEPTFSNVKCKVSFSLRTQEKFKEQPDTVQYEKQPKLFFFSGQDLKEGDFIVARKMNGEEVQAVYEGQCGLPNHIGSHQEVVLNVHGDA